MAMFTNMAQFAWSGRRTGAYSDLPAGHRRKGIRGWLLEYAAAVVLLPLGMLLVLEDLFRHILLDNGVENVSLGGEKVSLSMYVPQSQPQQLSSVGWFGVVCTWLGFVCMIAAAALHVYAQKVRLRGGLR